ncbi:MAG: putative zinc-binding metallopeptidase [Thermoflexales bacterium]|nr:putative zinc-binding metallopeptidase [Thermoflexales bacterium]
MRKTRALLYQPETIKTEVLNTPIHRLGLRVKGTIFEQAIPTVMGELRAKGITRLNPVFYLSTSYGCIAGSPIIALGFYDCTQTLKDINYALRGWYYSEADVYNLLRHEAGHAFCYAYKLYRQPEFRELFEVEGNFFNTYPDGDTYDYNPWSRNYVNPSGDHYAQKHPDEDFAETFQVWLMPRSGWKRKYRYKPMARRKIEYVAHIVAELGGTPPLAVTNLNWMYEKAEDMKVTVAEFMGANPDHYRAEATGYLDPDVQALFRPEPRGIARRDLRKNFIRADLFLRAQKLILINRIAYWTGVDVIVARDLIEKLIHRARALELWTEREGLDRKLIEVTAYLTTLCANYKTRGSYLSA